MLMVHWRMRHILLICLLAGLTSRLANPSAQERTSDAPKTEDGKVEKVAAWKLKRADDAKECALRSLGLKAGTAASAELVTVESDDTPFLADKLNGREMWLVTVPDWSIELRSAPNEAEAKDRYRRTVDILLDPETGHVVKVKTRWPESVPKRGVEPDSKSLEAAMDPGRYHGFPQEPSPISFLEALEALDAWAGMALEAEQIEAVWVVWSYMNRERRAMWVITLWGTPAFGPFHPTGEAKVVPNETMFIVVDPTRKHWVMTSTVPNLGPPQESKEAHDAGQ